MRIRWRGFELPTEVVADKATLTDRYGKFIIEPFEKGFGTTLGNSLRRVLLSSLEGAAVTAVQFDGVLHEFSTIPGVLEDVTDIVLNLKQLRLRMLHDQPSVVRLDVEKEGPVTAADLQTEAGVEVVNKDLLLCTITEKRRLTARIEVQKGRGYRTAEENEPEEQVVGRIAIDSIFSPVLRVNYRTEDTRVGQRTNYDRLILEIWTDGTITPGMALVEAGKILRKHLNPFVEYRELGHELAEGTKRVQAPVSLPEVSEEMRAKLDMPLAQLGLSARAMNCLRSINVETVGDLIKHSVDDLLQIRNFGKGSLNEVESKLAELGLSLAATAGQKGEPK